MALNLDHLNFFKFQQNTLQANCFITHNFGSPQNNAFLNFLKCINILLPGHICVLQLLSSLAFPSPEQSLPPLDGVGLVHDLVRVIVPDPQLFVHALHEVNFE